MPFFYKFDRKNKMPTKLFLCNPFILSKAFIEMDISNRVFIHNLPYEYTSDDLRRLFEQFGPMESCDVIPMTNSRGEKISRGIGFITFKTRQSYLKCLGHNEKLIVNTRKIGISSALPHNSSESKGSKEKNDGNHNSDAITYNSNIDSVQYHSTKPKGYNKKMKASKFNEANDTLFVSNIPMGIADYQLRRLFLKYKPYELKICEIKNADVQYAFIRIKNQEFLEKALVEMNCYELNNHTLYVSLADTAFSATT
ncbi:hypothetical protein TRFO_09300 [Tritrichomonas foetus]|uniref:RRM domain-containing protein n=1 Tax=Tritrichomonas foetus TaxID=1144522 RepID=A0A1J4JH68_9EUKA|nr:hypothetical protein TRFO_09300 [Tritrichomonas foetus]|eukprot:OHS97607.1 hypothetical protein TRFO_09300 [Tritrichomonas foetus]